jgi:NADH:ubiquinone oxidoreductase subunit 5 (subunit L)/multisubunit Na+/H+ antiporter MnhA subunit
MSARSCRVAMGSIFYIIHHITVKTALFLISGITERATGTQQLRETGGLLNAYPLVATLFMLAALSLAGMPPLSGFFAKLWLLTAGVREEQYVYVGVALLGSLLTLVSMSKIYIYVFMCSGERQSRNINERFGMPIEYRRIARGAQSTAAREVGGDRRADRIDPRRGPYHAGQHDHPDARDVDTRHLGGPTLSFCAHAQSGRSRGRQARDPDGL